MARQVTTEAEAALDVFHAHLDVCQRCREHPFNLCPVGAPLLMQAGSAAAERLGGGGPSKPYSMGTEVQEACDCDHEPDEEHKANCEFWSVPVTGRSSVPRMQNIPVRTELGKQIREAFIRPLKDDVRFVALSTNALEHRVHAALHAHEKKPNCPLCAAGVPFKEK